MEIWVFLTLAIITNAAMNKSVQMLHSCGGISSENVPQSVISQRANTYIIMLCIASLPLLRSKHFVLLPTTYKSIHP